MAIVGSILGDIAGSQFEFDRAKDWKNCELYTEQCLYTDDTVMTLAIKHAIDKSMDYQSAMREIGQKYPLCGYGGMFADWMFSEDPKPYKSYGNGSAMRVSYVADYFETMEEVIDEAKNTALVTHNSTEGIRGAVTTAVCIWLAKNGKTKQEVYDYMLSQYPEYIYTFSNKPLDYLRENYKWDATCMTSIPVALRCVYESESYISFLRNVFSLECDCDTLCAIGGGVAEELFGINDLKYEKILKHYLSDELFGILHEGLEAGYRMRYKDKWIEYRHVLGRDTFYSFDRANEIKVKTLEQVQKERGRIVNNEEICDCSIKEEDIIFKNTGLYPAKCFVKKNRRKKLRDYLDNL